MTGVIARNWWYYSFYIRNYLAEQKRRHQRYGARSFLPHLHIPSRIPAADGWYCVRCGTRKSIVQFRARAKKGS